MSTARVKVLEAIGQPFATVEVPLPEKLAPGEVLVKLTCATICGSDLHTLEGKRSEPLPSVLGHEGVGIVVASARKGVEVGQRVTWTSNDFCGHCEACIDYHLPNKCDELFKYGHSPVSDGSGLNGCYASHIVVRSGTPTFVVPDELSDRMVAPANCALATIFCALEGLPVPCRNAWVQGAGLLGIYACALLHHRGVRVFCTDVSEERLALAAKFGAIPLNADAGHWAESRATIQRACPRGVDLVIELAGVSAVLGDGIKLTRYGGHYVWVGMVHKNTPLAFNGEDVVRKCLTVKGVHNYAPEHLSRGLQFLAATRDDYPYEDLVSPPMPLDEIEQAVELAMHRAWARVALKP